MVNVTMLVHNRPRLTEQALRTLGHHNEMLVLDDTSDEETKRVIQSFPVDVYSIGESRGTGYARNLVIHQSERIHGRGDYLYLSDNDVAAVRPDWLTILIACYEIAWESGFRVIGGYNHPFHHPVASVPTHRHYRVHEVQALALQSMLMKWSVWDEYGPFDETPPGMVCQGEDVAFGNKIKAGGGRLGVVSPPLLVNTGITNSFGQAIPGAEIVRAQIPVGVYAE